MTENAEFLTITEFAKKLRCHANTIRKGIKAGRIQAIRAGTSQRAHYRIPNTEAGRMCEMDTTKLIDMMVEEKLEKRLGDKNGLA